VKFYELAADQGHGGAMYNYAGCLRDGIGVAKDEAEAAKYFKLAADAGIK
jgi:TPR repeat protein